MNIPGVGTVYIGQHFERPHTAIVNSHQSRCPRCEDSWVRNTVECIDTLAKRHLVLLGSIGLNCHELPLWYAGKKGVNQIVVTPIRRLDHAEAVRETILSDFDLNPERTGFLFFKSAETVKKSPIRDRIILDLADRVFPVSIREKGRIRNLLAVKPMIIDRQFEVPFENRRTDINIPDARKYPEGENSKQKNPNWRHLTHWTRHFDGPFPKETKAAYYRSVIDTPSEYSHSALRSLIRMLDEQTIFAGNQGIRGGHRVVSFTELPPEAAVRVMKWNSARVRYAFEPYGIAINKTRLESLGARPVIYGDTGDFDNLDKTDRPFYQNQGKRQRWTKELEWRIRGNLRLSDIPKTDMIVIVPDKPTAQRLGRIFPDYGIQCLAD